MLNKPSMLLFCWQVLFAYACYGQVSDRNYFYEKEHQQFVLSERNRTTGSFDKLKSLFIWKKDTVYRIIFEYETPKSKSLNEQSRDYHLYPLLSFLNSAGHINLYDKNGTEIKEIYNNYDTFRLYGKKSELTEFTKKEIDDGGAYTTKLKVLINNWNRKHNPMADKLASIPMIDGNGEVLLRNRKRKATFHNNFPLAFSLPGIDSVYFAKVYLISLYRALPPFDNKDKVYQPLKTFELFSTVPFEDGSSGTDASLGSYGTLGKTTLPFIFKLQLPTDTAKMFDRLAQFKQVKYDGEYDYAVIANDVTFEPSIEYSSRKSKSPDTLNQIQNPKPVVLKEDLQAKNGLAEYCKECYDTTYSIVYRIANHCPVSINTSADSQPQNWSYAFTQKGLHFFNVENQIRLFLGDPLPSSEEFCHLKNIWNWQLMSPGIGYWLSNSEDFGLKYKPSAIDYYINGNITVHLKQAE